MLTGEPNLARAARAVMEHGPARRRRQAGEYGAALFTADGFFALPGFPLEDVRDPTGAGDSFAGGFLGYLDGRAASGSHDDLRCAGRWPTAPCSPPSTSRSSAPSASPPHARGDRRALRATARMTHFDAAAAGTSASDCRTAYCETGAPSNQSRRGDGHRAADQQTQRRRRRRHRHRHARPSPTTAPGRPTSSDHRRDRPGDGPAPDQGRRGRLRDDGLRPGLHQHRVVPLGDHLHRRRGGDPRSTAAIPIEQLCEQLDLPRGRLPADLRRAADAAAARALDLRHHPPHLRPRGHQAVLRGLPLRRPPDGDAARRRSARSRPSTRTRSRSTTPRSATWRRSA